MTMNNLKDRIALVTGASKGIGEAIALRLGTLGSTVVVNYNTDEAGAERVATEINSAGGRAFTICCNVAEADQVSVMVDRVVSDFGKIDILVNNAGITRDKLLLRMTDHEWDEVINVNLRGAFLCTRAVARHMVAQRYGRIVNMSSVVGVHGNPGQVNYAASKAGVIGFTKAVAKELASRNITVNAVAPGYITTSMVERLPDEIRTRILASIPSGRFGTSDDVAQAAAFLCMEESGYITGQVLGIDGGMAV